MSKNCPIMTRMKNKYEIPQRNYFQRGIPLILTLDGRSFSNYTKKLNKPFDKGFLEDMQLTTIYLCSEIMGAKCGYTQSDEIHILVTDYDTINTDAFFDYRKDKILSSCAAMASSYFNRLRIYRESIQSKYEKYSTEKRSLPYDIIKNFKLGNFDCRGTSYPVNEVANFFLARQRDAVKNSISMLAQSVYSHNELKKKNQSHLHNMLHEKELNWNDLPINQKRGSFIVKNTYWNDKLVTFNNKGEGRTEELVQIHGKYYTPALPFDGSVTKGSEPPYKIRNKWELIETPLKFNYEIFKELI